MYRPEEELPCERAKKMAHPFQTDKTFHGMVFPGIFHVEPVDVCHMFGIDTKRGLRIYMGIHDPSVGYRRHRAIAVPTICNDLGVYVDMIHPGEVIIREMSFPCPDMCGNIADYGSPLFFYDIKTQKRPWPEGAERHLNMVDAIKRFQMDEGFTKMNFPGIFTFKYDDVRKLFDVTSNLGMRVYLGMKESDKGCVYGAAVIPTKLDETTLIYQDLVERLAVSTTVFPNRQGDARTVDKESPLFFYDSKVRNEPRESACKPVKTPVLD